MRGVVVKTDWRKPAPAAAGTRTRGPAPPPKPTPPRPTAGAGAAAPRPRTPRRAPARPARRGNGFAALALLAMVSTVSATGFFLHAAAPAPAGDAGELAGLELAAGPDDFQFAGVQFGMTMADVASRHPRLVRTVEGGTAKAGFIADGARHTVWFAGGRGGGVAYRMRVDETYVGVPEHEVHTRLGRLFGRPASADCRRGAVLPGERCRFQWWLPRGVHVDAIARTSDAEGAAIRLTTIATNRIVEANYRAPEDRSRTVR